MRFFLGTAFFAITCCALLRSQKRFIIPPCHHVKIMIIPSSDLARFSPPILLNTLLNTRALTCRSSTFKTWTTGKFLYFTWQCLSASVMVSITLLQYFSFILNVKEFFFKRFKKLIFKILLETEIRSCI